MFRVYIIKNIITNRVYVGRTQRAVEFRFHDHMRMLRTHRHNNKIMQADYDQYGASSFVVKEFGAYTESLDAGRVEIFMQIVMRSKDSKYGYNYMDRMGTGKRAEDAKWRIPAFYWNYPGRACR